MLSMALPIALVWLMKAKTRGKQVLYGFLTCLLFAAIIATFRKSAILVPASVIGALAYFRRRELLRFSPLGLVLIVVIHVVSPGAIGSTVQQFQSSRLGAATVNDRSVDYDAIRPELWSHLLLGKGWGSYDRVNFRVLDTEILQRIIEMGLIGLGLFLLIPLAVVFCARKLIADRNDPRAPLALVGAAAAIAFAAASTLFDILSFPHSTYIFLYMAGLVAVIVRAPRRPAPPQLQPGVRETVRLRRAADTHGPVRHREPAVETEALR
jgi:O-antigen ligase